MNIRYVLALIFLGGCASSCSSGGSSPPPPPPPNAEPGGIWFGLRPNGTEFVAFISEEGHIRTLDPFGNQGFGTVTVTNQTDISAAYKLVPEFGGTIIDGSDFADCTFAGTLQERQSMTYVVDCVTSLGGQLGGPDIVVTYDPAYEMDSSIARIAGTFQNQQGDIVTIDVSGAIFVQSSLTGCVVNGQVSLIDTDWNMYGVSATTELCEGNAAPLNGASWSGLAVIAVIDGMDIVVAGLTADIAGRDASWIAGWQRL